MAKAIFYYFPYTEENKKAKKLLENSGLEFETFAIDSREKLAAIAYDALIHDGPKRAPALWDGAEGKFYVGLKEIENYISARTKK